MFQKASHHPFELGVAEKRAHDGVLVVRVADRLGSLVQRGLLLRDKVVADAFLHIHSRCSKADLSGVKFFSDTALPTSTTYPAPARPMAILAL